MTVVTETNASVAVVAVALGVRQLDLAFCFVLWRRDLSGLGLTSLSDDALAGLGGLTSL